VAPWVMLNEPFQLLASGVRAVETITAAVMAVVLLVGVGFWGFWRMGQGATAPTLSRRW